MKKILELYWRILPAGSRIKLVNNSLWICAPACVRAKKFFRVVKPDRDAHFDLDCSIESARYRVFTRRDEIHASEWVVIQIRFWYESLGMIPPHIFHGI